MELVGHLPNEQRKTLEGVHMYNTQVGKVRKDPSILVNEGPAGQRD